MGTKATLILMKMAFFKKKQSNPTIFLHIGINKTGTTTIQNVLSQQYRQLLKKGILYPKAGRNGVAHYKLSHALGFFQGKTKHKSCYRQAKEIKKQLLKEINLTQPKAIILSSEMFVLPKSVKVVKDFFSEFEVKIVVYLRRHDDWWESAYNQAVKTVVSPPWQQGFANFLRFKRKNPNYGNYRFLLDNWADVFGRENIIVRPFEYQQNKPNIVVDFFKAIGFESISKQLDFVSERKNESLSSYALNMIDVFQRAKIEQVVREKLVAYVKFNSKPKIEEFSVIKPQMRHRLVDENLETYQYIAKKFLHRENEQLFFEPLPNPNEAWQSPCSPTQIEVVEQMVAALEFRLK